MDKSMSLQTRDIPPPPDGEGRDHRTLSACSASLDLMTESISGLRNGLFSLKEHLLDPDTKGYEPDGPEKEGPTSPLLRIDLTLDRGNDLVGVCHSLLAEINTALK